MTNIRAFAYRNKENILNKSSSGGAFTAIVDAMYNINDTKPIVFGVTFDEDLNVVYEAAYSKEECSKFRGSKYVRSSLGNTAELIEELLINNNVVLFTGIPCQVYSIKKRLSKKNLNLDNFYCVDLICHGTPNVKLWNEFKRWLEDKNKSKIKKFSFRYSNSKWKAYPCMAEFENGTRKINTQDVRIFTNLFFTHLGMNEMCYSCKFANMKRVGDLTIGDFWGINDAIPNFTRKHNLPDSHGISLILQNNIKGEKIMKAINETRYTDNKIILEECHTDKYLKHQHNLNKPIEKPIETENFRKDFNNKGFEYIISKYAGYNTKGKVIFTIKKILYNTGTMKYVNKFLKNR